VTVNAAITFTVLFAIVLLSLVARGLSKAQGGIVEAALYMLFWALDMLPHLLTISFLLATVLTFARAVQDRELVAIRSAGIPPRVPMVSALLVGLVLSIVSSLALHYVLPAVHFRKYRIGSEIMRNMFNNMNLGTDRIRFPCGHQDFIMDYRRQDAGGFQDCTIYAPPKLLARLSAGNSGFRSPILKADRVSMPPADLRNNVISIVIDGLRDPVTANMIQHTKMDVSASELSGSMRNERDDDLSSDQLLAEVTRNVHEAPTAAWYTLWRRCCFAVMPVLMAPIAFCIAQLAYQRGRMIALVASIAPLALFYSGDILGAKLLRTTDWPVFGWFPAMLLTAFGAPFCVRTLRL
jgi:lipopolysaccharide export LptBFGC system permease protein LptF